MAISSIINVIQETKLSHVLSGEALPRMDNYRMSIQPGIQRQIFTLTCN
jgi:hypothetical protein